MKEIYNKISLIKVDKLIYLAIFVIFTGFIINGCLLKICDMILPSIKSIVDILLLLVEGGIIGITILILFRKRTKRLLCTYGIIAAIVLLSYLIFPQNRNAILLMIRNFLLYNVTCFILFMEVSEDELLFKKLIKIMKWVFAFAMLYLVLLFINRETTYNIWLAKYFFLTAVFISYDFYKNKSIPSFIISAISLITLLVTGSRTYLLLYIGFAILIFLISLIRDFKTLNDRKKVLLIVCKIIILITVIIILVNYTAICDSIYEFFSDKGVEIRILKLISSNNLFTSNARTNQIYPISFNLIKENPIIGSGICGDRVTIFEFYNSTNNLKEGKGVSAYYSHNIILELYSNFGILFGTTMLAVVLYSYYKTIKMKMKKKNISVIICMTFSSVLPLMLTGTMWDNTYLWSLLGLLIANLLNLNCQNNEEKEKTNEVQGDKE